MQGGYIQSSGSPRLVGEPQYRRMVRGAVVDHYRCNHFFVPEIRAYRISGSAELFPQHCQVPILLWNENLQEVINELKTTLDEITPERRSTFIKQVIDRLELDKASTHSRTLTAPSHHWM
jgi:hypothetical protein